MTRETDVMTGGVFCGTEVNRDDDGHALCVNTFELEAVTGPNRGRVYRLDKAEIAIGANPESDIVLGDSAISWRHAVVILRGERPTLRDQGSTNGTMVDGTRVIEAYLNAGSRVTIGRTELVFRPSREWVHIPASEADRFEGLIGQNSEMRRIFGLLERIAATDLSVIVSGETGTGKELVARALHGRSVRSSGRLVVLDCGAISENLIESELFGHEKGAFTGAVEQRKGAFELASGGTLFLDEIGELALDLQPKLLRALEAHEVKRLGADRPINVDVRVLAATNRDLRKEVRAGSFRSDLYFRLAEVVVELPPLRERADDIPLIVEALIADQRKRGSRVARVLNEAMTALKGYPWPGNVRELRNVIRQGAALAEGTTLGLGDLPPNVTGNAAYELGDPGQAALISAPVHEDLPMKEARERWNEPQEREYLLRLLKRFDGDLDRAAQSASLHRKSLERYLRKHGLRARGMTDEDPDAV